MINYFKPTTRKILGTIILLFFISFIGLWPAATNPMACIAGKCNMFIGLPLIFFSINEKGETYSNFINLIIDMIIFYLIICVLSIAFKRRKENVPNSNSGGRDTSSSNQAQP